MFETEISQIVEAVHLSQSLMLVGESGSGKTELAKRAIARLSNKRCALVSYIRGKQAVVELAEALGIDITETKYDKKGEPNGERKLTQEELETEILANANRRWVLFIDDADRWAQSLRLWLLKVERAGVPLVLLCTKEPQKDIFLRRTKVVLSQPSAYEIREIMRRHAAAIAHPLTAQEVADLQQYAGCNLSIAKLVVEQHKQGIKPKADQHRNTIVIAPYVMAGLSGFAVLRFVGLGTGNRTLYLIGGVCLAVVMGMRMMGQEAVKKQRGLGQ